MIALVSFDAERLSKYMERVFAGYLKDPADSAWQRAYLAAHLDLYRECLNKGLDEHRLALLDTQVRG